MVRSEPRDEVAKALAGQLAGDSSEQLQPHQKERAPCDKLSDSEHLRPVVLKRLRNQTIIIYSDRYIPILRIIVR